MKAKIITIAVLIMMVVPLAGFAWESINNEDAFLKRSIHGIRQ